MVTDTKKSDVPTDFGRVEVRAVGGPRPYLWLGLDEVCIDTFEGANLRKLAKAIERLLSSR